MPLDKVSPILKLFMQLFSNLFRVLLKHSTSSQLLAEDILDFFFYSLKSPSGSLKLVIKSTRLCPFL